MSRIASTPSPAVPEADQPAGGGDLDESIDSSWRDRVVARGLGPAIEQAVERAGQFIQATLQLMEESGDNITVQDIADRAGMSLRLLYRYFSGKDDLVVAVLEELLREGGDRVRALADGAPSPDRRVRRLLRASVDVAVTPANAAYARHESSLMVDHTGAIARAQAPWAAVVTDVLAEAGADPGAAYLVMAGKRAFNWSRLLGNEFGLATPSADEFVSFYLRGLGQDPDAQDAPQ